MVHICWYQLGFLTVAMLVVVGPVMGTVTLTSVLARHGLFADKCVDQDPSTAVCFKAQSNAIAAIANLALSLMNFAALPAGICHDVIGGWRLALAAAVLWTVGTSISGVAPSSGVWWAVGLCLSSVAVVFLFTAILFHHIRHASVAKRYAMWVGALTALRNMGSILNVALDQLFASPSIGGGGGAHVGDGEYRLWAGYLIYGLAAGLPCIAGLYLMFPRTLHINYFDCSSPEHMQLLEENPELDTFSGITMHDDATGEERPWSQRASLAVRATMATAGHAARDALFWICAARASCIVTVSYFMTANITAVAEHCGASPAEAADLRIRFNYLMCGLSLASLLPSKLTAALGAPRGLAVWSATAAALAACGAGSIGFAPQHSHHNVLYLAYLGFGALIVWRVTGFATVNLAAPVLLQCPGGAVFGLLYSFAGAVSIGAGSALTRLIQRDADALPFVVLGCGAAAVLLELLFMLLLLRKHHHA